MDGDLRPNTVFLEYRNFGAGIVFVQQSIDGGLTYGPATVVGTMSQTGALDVDQTDGTVYISGNDGQLAVGIPPAPGLPPLTYTLYQPMPTTVDPANIFVALRVANTGARPNTVYLCYSNGNDIFLISSSDHGAAWRAPVKVYNPADLTKRVNLMPWIATGPVPGTVGIACGLLGLTMIESTGMSGRSPLLSAQTNEPQLEAQVTWNTWPGVPGVLALKPPTAA